MRRLRVLGLMTAVVLLFATVAPAVYGQVLTPMTPTPTLPDAGTGAATPETTVTPGADSAPGQTGAGTGVPGDSAPGNVVTGSGTGATGGGLTGSTVGTTDAAGESADDVVRRATELLGTRVLSSDGRYIGRIDNFLVDPSTGDVVYALIATGGFMGLGEKLVAAPIQAFSYDLANDEFVLGMSARSLGQAPSASRYTSLAAGDFGANTELQDFWRALMGGVGATSTSTPEAGTGTGTGTGTGAGTGAATSTPEAGTGTGTGTGAGAVATATRTGITSGPLYTVTPIATARSAVRATATPFPTSTPAAAATGGTDTGVSSTGTPAATAESAATDIGATETMTATTEPGATGTGAGTDTSLPTTDDEFGSDNLIQVGSSGAASAFLTKTDLVRVTELGAYTLLSCPTGEGSTGPGATDTTGESNGISATDTMTGTGIGSGIGSTGTMTGTGTGSGIGSTGTMTGTGTGSGVGSTGTMTGTTGTGSGVGGTGTMTDTTGTGTGSGVGSTDAVTGTTGTGTPGTGDMTSASMPLGVVEDVLIDLRSAQIVYGVINVDGSDLSFESNDTGTTDTGTGTETGSDVGSTGTITDTTGTGSGVGSTGTMTGTTGTGSGGGSTGTMTDTTGTGTGASEATTDMGRLILVPWSGLTADAAASTLCFTLPAATLEDAPSTTGFEVPDTKVSGWDDDVRSFWDTALGAEETRGAGETGAGETGTGTSGTGTGSGIGGTGTATGTGATGAAMTGTVMEARRMVGLTVNDSAGQALGEVANLLIASDTGDILYGVVSYGGFLGFGGAQVAIPWGAFTFDSANNTLTVPTDQSTLDAAPKLSDLGPSGISQPGWDSAVQQYWQQRGIRNETGATGSGATGTGAGAGTGAGSGVGTTGTMTDTTGSGATGAATPGAGATPAAGSGTGVGATGTMTGTSGTTGAASGAQLLRADRVIGMNVRGTDKDQALGEVTDLLIHVEAGQVFYVLVGSGGFLGIGQTTKAVPWEALTFSGGDNTFVLDITAEELQAAPDLAVEGLPDTADPNWDANVRQFWQTRTSR